MTKETASIGSFFERLKSILNSNIVNYYIVEIIVYTYRTEGKNCLSVI